MDVIDIPIGTRFHCDDALLEVVESNHSCIGCYFDIECINCSSLACLRARRNDGKNVIFKIVED